MARPMQVIFTRTRSMASIATLTMKRWLFVANHDDGNDSCLHRSETGAKGSDSDISSSEIPIYLILVLSM